MPRTTGRAMSVSAAHALHFQIPKMAAPTPPSLLKRQHSSTSPRLLASRPSSPVTIPVTVTLPASPRRGSLPVGPVIAGGSPPRAPRSPPRPALARRDTPRPASPELPIAPPGSATTPKALAIEVNEFEATFRAARPVAAAAN